VPGQTPGGWNFFTPGVSIPPSAAPAPNGQGQIYANQNDGQVHAMNAKGVDGVVMTNASATTVNTAAAPAATASLTPVMMACGGSIAPVLSTRIEVTISGQVQNSTAADGATVQLRYGTGTAPLNGAAVTGTQAGIAQTITSVTAGQGGGFSITAIISGLTVGQAVWLDAALQAVTGGSASISGVTICAEEI
jgi:hypothetical protein